MLRNRRGVSSYVTAALRGSDVCFSPKSVSNKFLKSVALLLMCLGIAVSEAEIEIQIDCDLDLEFDVVHFTSEGNHN